MKTIKSLLLVVFLLPLEAFSQKTATDLQIKKVLIYTIPEKMQTQIGISCNDFESSNNQFPFFKTFQLNSSNENDNKKILALKTALENHKNLSYPANRLDIRAKAYIIYTSGQIDCLCMTNAIYYSYNGTTMSFADSSSYEVVRQIVWGNE
jgi:hypothetical protein